MQKHHVPSLSLLHVFEAIKVHALQLAIQLVELMHGLHTYVAAWCLELGECHHMNAVNIINEGLVYGSYVCSG